MERAIISSTVFYIDNTTSVTKLSMAWFTEIIISSAVKESHRTAKAALPVDICFTVGVANFTTNPKVNKQARLAAQVFFFHFFRFFLSHFQLAVNKTSKERLHALRTFVKCALVESPFLRLLEKMVVRVLQAGILKKSLSLGDLKRFNINFCLQLGEFFDIVGQLKAVDLLERSLAARTAHESERDFKGRPLVLKKISNTGCVKNVTAEEHNAGIRSELCCKTYRAYFILFCGCNIF